MTATDTRATIDAVWRIESARVIAGVAGVVHDVGLAEEFAHDALVQALQQWPQSGVPGNPGAWLTSTAKRRAIDHIRRNERYQDKLGEIGRDLRLRGEAGDDIAEAITDEIGDDLLRLVFVACHPELTTDARVALTLRLLGGLTTKEIARAFLTSESTIGQRISRAKRTLADRAVPFAIPEGPELAERLSSVLEVIYLVFNEGYAATAGEDLLRPELCREAMRLGRVVAELAPKEPEVHGLVALLELQASRTAARVRQDGSLVPLLEQDRSRWDRLLINRGLAAIDRARAIGAPVGPYLLQAQLAACHARAGTPEQTDWQEIARLYGQLVTVMPSPIVELNRGVAIGMADGPQAGLEHVDALQDEPALARYHLLPSVRGDLLVKLGRYAEAAAEFCRARGLTGNEAERELLAQRAADAGERA